jgi:hypothetical protein
MSAQIQNSDFGTVDNVVPLRAGRRTYGTEILPTDYLIAAHGAELVAQLEAVIFRAVAQQQIRSVVSAFDAVYISSLEPDLISNHSIDKLFALAKIEDRSHEIEFDDGLD